MIDPDDPNFVLVTLEIKNEVKLPSDSKAVLLSKIVGGKSIEIRFTQHCKDNCLQPRDTIQGVIAGALGSIIGKDEFQDYLKIFGGELNTILDTLTDPQGKTQLSIIIKNLSETLHSLAAVSQKLDLLMTNSSKNLEHTFSNLNQISNTLSKNSNALGQSLQNLEKITGSLEKADPGKLVTNANQTINEGKKTLQELGNTVNALNKVIDKIDAGQGTMGKLINDPALYKNLERTSKNLDLFLQDIRLNPKRYIHVSVFGSKSKEYETPAVDPADVK
jgi:phospholipid/cholesterol/gamma-HCH transport system substrate-binding protein